MSTLPATHKHHDQSLPDADDLRVWMQREVVLPAGTTLCDLTPTRAFPGRRGHMMEWSIQLATPGGARVVRLQGTFDSGRWQGATEHRKAQVNDSPFLHGLRIHSPDKRLTVCSPDRDRRLRLVRRLLQTPIDATGITDSTHNAASTAQRDVPNGLDPALTVIGYRIGKRCVLKAGVDQGTRRCFLKISRARRLPTLAELTKLSDQLDQSSGGAVALVPLLQMSKDGSWQLTEAIDGVPPDAATGATTVPAVLAVLHGATPPATLGTHGAADELQTVTRWLGLANTLASHRLATVVRLVAAMQVAANRIGAAGNVLIHRDCHHRQFVMAEGKSWILDFDSLSLGHAEQDVATYLSHVLFEDEDHPPSPDTMQSTIAAFVEAYRHHGGRLDRSIMTFYLGASAARFACICMTRSASDAVVDSLLHVSEQALCSERFGRACF